MTEHIEQSQLLDRLESLANGNGYTLDRWQSENRLLCSHIDTTWMLQKNEDMKWCHVVCHAYRPIMAPFCKHIEFTYFHPTTPLNDLLKASWYKMDDVLFAFISVPLGCKPWLFEGAKTLGMRLADGHPHVMYRDGENLIRHEFPLNNNQTFTLQPINE